MSAQARDGAAVHPLEAALRLKARNWSRPEMERGPRASGWPTLREALADREGVEAMLAGQARAAPGLDRKGQAAYLMTDLSLAVAALAAAALAGTGVVPRMGPDHLALRRAAPTAGEGEAAQGEKTGAGGPPRLRLLSARFVTDRADLADHPDAETAADRDALCDRLRLELEAHLAPVAEALAAAGGSSRAALWRLAGDSISARFLDAGRRFGREAEAKAEALRVLKHPGGPLTNPQMHYFDISIPDPAAPERSLLTRAFRARGGCCRWYTAAPGRLCTTCVLRSDADRRAVLEDGLRRRLGLPPRAEAAAPRDRAPPG